jgi:hypothetical protein
MLAFALTVHRAQGQTLSAVEIDCYSCFAPGQMGVAVGRAVSKDGLRIRNFSSEAAHLKHPQCVYDFYLRESTHPVEDLSCCHSLVQQSISTADSEPSTSKSPGEPPLPPPPPPTDSYGDRPQLESPWKVSEFLATFKLASFLACITPGTETSEALTNHLHYAYHHVHRFIQHAPKHHNNGLLHIPISTRF